MDEHKSVFEKRKMEEDHFSLERERKVFERKNMDHLEEGEIVHQNLSEIFQANPEKFFQMVYNLMDRVEKLEKMFP